ncbi:MAG: hypothetical protein Pyrs2KO_16700 [Pyruvatibacter sp.]
MCGGKLGAQSAAVNLQFRAILSGLGCSNVGPNGSLNGVYVACFALGIKIGHKRLKPALGNRGAHLRH